LKIAALGEAAADAPGRWRVGIPRIRLAVE
jgi:hypothetical protein